VDRAQGRRGRPAGPGTDGVLGSTIETAPTPPTTREREALLEWFVPRSRVYPWRRTRDPYRILVSEVMLQQTQAARVVGAYRSFLRSFPSLPSLAKARRSAVVSAWGGLGYPRRAAALSQAARAIVDDLGGTVPSEPTALQELPGIGPYTAAAEASIAFGVPVAAVDTNVRRIVARVAFGTHADDIAPADLAALARRWLDPRAPGAWNQALMDLGREVCRPARPRCDACPLASSCRFRARGAQPRASRKKHPSFEGSLRQARGAVLRELRAAPSCTMATLVRSTGLPIDRVTEAVRGLAADGIARATRAAAEGHPRARVGLAD
jgi:A/G-specific adenine glycosylase